MTPDLVTCNLIFGIDFFLQQYIIHLILSKLTAPTLGCFNNLHNFLNERYCNEKLSLQFPSRRLQFNSFLTFHDSTNIWKTGVSKNYKIINWALSTGFPPWSYLLILRKTNMIEYMVVRFSSVILSKLWCKMLYVNLVYALSKCFMYQLIPMLLETSHFSCNGFCLSYTKWNVDQ